LENQLKKLIGPVSYALLKRQLRNVKLKIDVEKKLVTITKDERKYEFKFDEIERMVNELTDKRDL